MHKIPKKNEPKMPHIDTHIFGNAIDFFSGKHGPKKLIRSSSEAQFTSVKFVPAKNFVIAGKIPETEHILSRAVNELNFREHNNPAGAASKKKTALEITKRIAFLNAIAVSNRAHGVAVKDMIKMLRDSIKRIPLYEMSGGQKALRETYSNLLRTIVETKRPDQELTLEPRFFETAMILERELLKKIVGEQNYYEFSQKVLHIFAENQGFENPWIGVRFGSN